MMYNLLWSRAIHCLAPHACSLPVWTCNRNFLRSLFYAPLPAHFDLCGGILKPVMTQDRTSLTCAPRPFSHQ